MSYLCRTCHSYDNLDREDCQGADRATFVEIAEVLREAGQHDRALEWAERGIAAFSEVDPRQHDLLADEYARRGRHDAAVGVMWAEFVERPYLEAYQKLKRYAVRAGSWPAWRAKALALVRARVGGARRTGDGMGWHDRADHSGLVRLFLWEGDLDAAWSEAREGGCSGDLWRELAQRREREYPEDALAVYRSLLEPALAPKNDAAYADATALLRRMRDLLRRLGRDGEFADELVAVRAAHRRKRNFTRMLDVFD